MVPINMVRLVYNKGQEKEDKKYVVQLARIFSLLIIDLQFSINKCY